MHIANGRLRGLSRVVAVAATAAFLLHGCGGGSDGSPGTTGATGAAGPQGPAGPAGTPAAAVSNVSTLSAQEFAATRLSASIISVAIASPPVVTFKVTDQNGMPVVGFGKATKSATATVPRYQNISFTLAKLVPGAAGLAPGTSGPSRWVSYVVTTVPTTTAAATGSRPTSDSNGTLVDNGDGTYKYTFYRDVTKVKDQVAAMTFTGVSAAADLGDLTYDANAVHRLGMQISGSAPGTGINTADEVQVTPAVPMARPVNVIYDFVPATGKQVATADAGQRLVVDVANCNECHVKLGGIPGTQSQTFHGGTRYDPKYCVTCHTDQRKFGQARATSTANVFTAASTSVADGQTVGDFPQLIHKVHAGDLLVKSGYYYAGVKPNEVMYPQDIRNCDKCHDNTAPKTAPQASNFKTVPSRLGCGSCHDGINWATGQGVTNFAADQAKVNGGTPAATGHVGGAQADDGKCALCHDANSIATVYHTPVAPPDPANVLNGGTNPYTNAAWIASRLDNLPAGAAKVSYEVQSVARNASKQPVIVFRTLVNGVVTTFNSPGLSSEILTGFVGSPSAQFVFAVPQDGITVPSDFNAAASGYLRSIWNGTAAGAGAGTLSAPDAAGYYTLTLTGVVVPDNAVMLTGGIGFGYSLPALQPLTQTNLGGKYAFDAVKKTGGLIVVSPTVQKVATGYTGRRAIVDDRRCNSCHQELGVFTLESFHVGQRNDGTTCAWCHTPNKTSSGWTADSTQFVHAIHAASKRSNDYTWHASAVGTAPFAEIGYPGILSNCESCHLPGTYDYSTASDAQKSGRLLRTTASGTVLSTTATALQQYSASPDVKQYPLGTSFGAGFSVSATGVTAPAAGTNLVTSPTTAVCVSCHDSSLAQAHMKANGGSIYATRTAALASQEQCLVCHASGKVADIKSAHAK